MEDILSRKDVPFPIAVMNLRKEDSQSLYKGSLDINSNPPYSNFINQYEKGQDIYTNYRK